MGFRSKRNIIIVGKTGSGKSSLGNNMLGADVFEISEGFRSVTLACEVASNDVDTIVDTPGLFEIDHDKNVASQALAVQRSMELCPDPHAVLLVLRMGRLNKEDGSTLQLLRIIFGEECVNHLVVVVTHVENDLDDEILENRYRMSQEVSKLIEECNNRVCRIDNNEPKIEHIRRIHQMVEEVSRHGKSTFHNRYLHCNQQVLGIFSDIEEYDHKHTHEQVNEISKHLAVAIEQAEIEDQELARQLRRYVTLGTVTAVGAFAAYHTVRNPERLGKLAGSITSTVSNAATSVVQAAGNLFKH